MVKRRKKRKKQSLIKRVFKFGLIAFITGLFFITIFIFAVYHNIFGYVPDEQEIQAIQHETATLIYSSDNKLIGKFFTENRTSVKQDELPDHLVNALISTEDVRYFEHEGIDRRSLLRVLVKTIILGDRSSGGGSTITQQLAKNLYGRNNYGFMSLPVVKVKESIIAYRLEKIYNKDEILLLYLNTVPFGENTYGIEAAANRYFNKTTSELNIQESAVLIGMLKANTYYNPRIHPENALGRRNMVLQLMAKYHYISQSKAEKLKESPLALNYNNYNLQGPAPYFLKHVRKKAERILGELAVKTENQYNIETDGLKIITTLNSQIQQFTDVAIKKHLSGMQKHLNLQLKGKKEHYITHRSNDSLKKREIFTWEGIKIPTISYTDSLWHYKKMLQAGVIIINPQNGQVLSWIGGNHYRYLPYDLVTAKRQAASAFKPVLYATAIEKGYKPCDYVKNTFEEMAKYPDWNPENYDGSSGGEAALWYALANSMNLPAVDLYRRIGYADLDYITRKLGFSSELPDGPSAALGTMDVSLQELAFAYSAFANNGSIPGQALIKEIQNSDGKTIYQMPEPDFQSSISKETAQIINAMLLKATSSGTGQALYNRYDINYELAGKTGTSQDYRDARYVCYNDKLVIAVWVGTRDKDIHFSSGAYGSGSRLALPVAGRTLHQMQSDNTFRPWLQPPEMPADTSGMFDCKKLREESTGRNIWQKMVDIVSPDKIKELDEEENQQEKEDEGVDLSDDKEKSKVGKFLEKLFKRN